MRAGFAILMFLGLVLMLLAGLFGLNQTIVVSYSAAHPGDQPTYAPNVAAGGAACGFGIAGGLCFLAAALFVQSRATQVSQEATLQILTQEARIRELEKELRWIADYRLEGRPEEP